jgi:hypothetical protein
MYLFVYGRRSRTTKTDPWSASSGTKQLTDNLNHFESCADEEEGGGEGGHGATVQEAVERCSGERDQGLEEW